MSNELYTLTAVTDRLGAHAYGQFLESQPTGDFLQTLAWGRVKSLTGWRSEPLVLQDRDGRIVLSALLLSRRLPGLPLRLFYAPRGPVLDWGQAPEQLEAILRAFTAEVRRLGRRRRSILLKCDPALPAGNDHARQALAAAGFRSAVAGLSFEGVQPRFVYEIDIRRDVGELLAAFGSKHRYNIRLAGRRGVTVRPAAGEQDMAAFYRLLEVTAERDRFGIRTYRYYEAIWREVVTAGGAELFLAERDGTLLSGALVFMLGSRAWYVYGASSDEGRNLMPNYALHWEIMLWLKGRGFAIYDMRGISGDLTPGSRLYGLYRFKKGFSGRVVEYAGEYDLPLFAPLYWAARAGVPAFRWLMKTIQFSRRRARAGAGEVAPEQGDTDPTETDDRMQPSKPAPPPQPEPPSGVTT